MTTVDGELVAAIGENRKMVVFPLDQVPEMARGRGVRLQRYKDKGLSDVATFEAEEGLTWIDAAGRSFTLTLKELADWRGNRADAGRIAPEGLPRPTTSSAAAADGKARASRPTSVRYVATNSSERSDFSSSAAAVSPKNSFSPGRRPTPMTMRLCCAAGAFP